ncbi:translocation/assembly module TamB domain-containing protein [Pseudidiomarina homiensis]|uniref:Translocation and assembly module TamB C-terminal domain-containing protein n=1 Tax=Pseudidiomarina homiensis TaxID=364198 RepID=A0A432XT11_9GAMM|nr:translocation/assembly module TamB domain-containing protein [Pseudidiomarina homiensis]RUO51803.1 hypothetical protein CWI70_12335 [Pseudidiomarina homiensis]
MRWLKRLATVIVALFILVPVLLYVLVSTTTGSRFMLSQALKFAPVSVSYDQLEGSLIDQLTLNGFVLQTPTQRYSADEVIVAWRPWELLDSQLTIEKLSLYNSKLQLLEQAQRDDEPIVLPTIDLPFTVDVAELTITNFAFQSADDASALSTLTIKLSSSLSLVDSQLKLNGFNLRTEQPEFSFAHNGSVSAHLKNNYPLQVAGSYTLAFVDTRIPMIEGTVNVDGALQNAPLQITSTFKGANTPEQKLTATVNSPLANPTWQGELTLTELPLNLVQPWLTDYAFVSDNYINADSFLSGNAQIDNDKIQLNQLTATNLNNYGEVTLNGFWQHNDFSRDYEQMPFDILVSYTNLGFQTTDLNLQAEVGFTQIVGTLDDFQFANQSVMGMKTATQSLIEELTVEIEGSGSMTQLEVAKLSLSSPEFEMQGTLKASWEDTLDVSLDIESGRSTIGLAGNEALLAGSLELNNNQLSFSDLAIALGQTELKLNGSTANDNLRGSLFVKDLQQLPHLPAGLSELQSLETEFSIDTQAQLSEFQILFQQFKLQTASLDSWLLTEPTQLAIKQQKQVWQAELDKLCLQHDANQFGVLCTELALTQESVIANLTGERLSLWLLNRFRERDVAQRIAGLVSLNATATFRRDSLQMSDLGLQLTSDNTVFFALNQETSTRLSYWELAARGNADAITAEVEGQLANNEGGLFGDLALLDIYTEPKVEGSLLFALDDLAMLDWVLPGMRYNGGKATAQLNLTGSLAEPSFSGDMEVYAESVVFAETNFVFNDVRLALIDQAGAEDEIEIQGQAKAGDDGWVLVEGVAMPLDAEAYLRITGQNFRALQMPTATVDVSPNLTVHVNNRSIDIAGTVDVPFAAIAAPDFETSVSNSNDVVITRDGEPVKDALVGGDELQVNAQIRVNLGQQVTVDAYGFTGRLQGSLEIMEEPRRPTTAIGSINVANGSYELYGQELNIDRGAFIYNGGDISNPGLNLRVKRDISNGNSVGNVNVGAQVVGTLTEPDFRLFSTPAMPDSEILSYLILGKSMQSASSTGSEDIQLQALLMLGAKGTDAIGESLQDSFGIDEFGIDNDPNTRETSFYIGKYLSPKLFVRYGVGLLESTNTFMVRYQLTERLLIETMTSSQAQGGDIFYTFER